MSSAIKQCIQLIAINLSPSFLQHRVCAPLVSCQLVLGPRLKYTDLDCVLRSFAVKWSYIKLGPKCKDKGRCSLLVGHRHNWQHCPCENNRRKCMNLEGGKEFQRMEEGMKTEWQ
jgi:hypothetical protein